MSDTITFTDQEEREFWERAAQRAFSEGYVASDAANQADDITIQRRKRLGPTPPGTPPAVTAEVLKLLRPDPDILWEIHRRLYKIGAFEEEANAMEALIKSIIAARASLKMDTKEQRP
jgi:hypothetical protein